MLVGLQMPDVLKQIDSAHAVGLEQSGGDHASVDGGWPAQLIHDDGFNAYWFFSNSSTIDVGGRGGVGDNAGKFTAFHIQ